MARCRTLGPIIVMLLWATVNLAIADVGAPGPPCELQWLLPEENSPRGSYTVFSCAMNDDWLMVGESQGSPAGVHVYRREGFTWVFDEFLQPEAPRGATFFGDALALEGDRLMVGVPGYDPQGDRPGAVYAYRRSGGSWTLEDVLIPSDEPLRSWFGSEIALSGNLLAVGAPSRASTVPYAGAIYIFEDTGSGWEEIYRLTLPDPVEDDQLGQALAIAAGRVIAGVRWRDHVGQNSGLVYVYKREGANWLEEARLWPDDLEEWDALGYDVAGDGDRFIVSALLADGVNPMSGRAHIYHHDGDSWVEEARLEDPESEERDHFGFAVALEGDVAAVGIPNLHTGSFNGYCQLYERDGAQWLPAGRISHMMPFETNNFGAGLAWSDGFLMVCGTESVTVYGTTPETCCPVVLVAPGPAEENPARVRGFDTLGNPYPDIDFEPYDEYGYGVRLATTGHQFSGYPGIITGPGPGENNPPEVRRHEPYGVPDGAPLNAYSVLKYGVNVAGGDLDGDGIDEVVTGAGPGAVFGPHVRGWEGYYFDVMSGVSFMAYGTNKYGVNVACGDIDGDGFDEIVTGAGPGAVFGPHVRAWNVDGGSAAPIAGLSYFAYGTLKWGVNVTCGDIDGDGFDEIVTGAGPGAVFGPHVRGWDHDGSGIAPIPGVSFLAYGTNKYGVRATCGDVDLDGIDEIVTTPGPGAVFGAHVRGWNYDGSTLAAIPGMSFFAYDSDWRYGADAAILDR